MKRNSSSRIKSGIVPRQDNLKGGVKFLLRCKNWVQISNSSKIPGILSPLKKRGIAKYRKVLLNQATEMAAKKINREKSPKGRMIKEMKCLLSRKTKKTCIKPTLNKKSLATSRNNSLNTKTILPKQKNLRKKRKKG